MKERKIYIGDSVYAEFDGFAVILTTENGFEASNTIALEPQIVAKLIKAWDAWHDEVKMGAS